MPEPITLAMIRQMASSGPALRSSAVFDTEATSVGTTGISLSEKGKLATKRHKRFKKIIFVNFVPFCGYSPVGGMVALELMLLKFSCDGCGFEIAATTLGSS